MRGGQAVVDADILIKLSRLDIVHKVIALFEEVHVPRAVAREVKMQGRQRRPRSFEKFRRAATICRRWDKTVFTSVMARLQRIEPRKRHHGESQAIAQAVLYRGAAVVLTDDKEAHELAHAMGLKVLSSAELVRMIALRR